MSRPAGTPHTVADRLPDDDALWARRAGNLTDLAREIAVDRSTLARHARSRGWRWSRGRRTGATHAPCAGCGRPETPVATMDDARACGRCRAGARTDLEREREAFLRRRPEYRAGRAA